MSKVGAPRRKLMILTTSAYVGGQERVACGLSRALLGLGWDVRLIFPEPPKREAFLKWCSEQGVNAEVTPALLDAAAPHHARDMLALQQLVRSWRPDIVNIHYGDNFVSIKDMLALRAAGRSPRYVVSVHHPTPWSETGNRKKLLTRAATRLADAVTTFSNATRDVLLEAGVRSSRLHVISCGLQVPKRLPVRAEARQRLGFAQDAFIIGCLGRLEPHKGVGDLVSAVAAMSDPSGSRLLAVAGDGPERVKWEAEAKTKLGDRARFLGRVPDIDDFLACCDVFALPSYLEGFGLVYVEAAFHGVPSVGTRVGGVPDAVHDERTGLLVPVGDVAALARALERLQADPELRRRLGDAARVRANTELTEGVMGERFERVFNQLH
jgi:glycosyltransferase involved in cell wall biosynthesis